MYKSIQCNCKFEYSQDLVIVMAKFHQVSVITEIDEKHILMFIHMMFTTME